MWGVFPDAIDWNIALHTQTLIWEANLRLDSKTPFRDGANFIGFYALKVFFWNLTSDTLTKKKNSEWVAQYPSLLLLDKHPHMPTFEAFNFF